MTDPEAKLVVRVGQGDEGALSELYERLGSRVYTLALELLKSREEAEEVVQDTFLMLYQKAHSYATPERSPRAFIYTIARNQALSRLRRRRARPLRAEGVEVDGPYTAVDPADPTPTLTTNLYVERLLAGLDEEERRLLEGAFFQGYSHAELAELTGLPLGTLKSELRRTLLKLRDHAEAL